MITPIVSLTIPDTFTSRRKAREYGGKEPLCLDEPQKRLTRLAQSLEKPSRRLPGFPPRNSHESLC